MCLVLRWKHFSICHISVFVLCISYPFPGHSRPPPLLMEGYLCYRLPSSSSFHVLLMLFHPILLDLLCPLFPSHLASCILQSILLTLSFVPVLVGSAVSISFHVKSLSCGTTFVTALWILSAFLICHCTIVSCYIFQSWICLRTNSSFIISSSRFWKVAFMFLTRFYGSPTFIYMLFWRQIIRYSYSQFLFHWFFIMLFPNV